MFLLKKLEKYMESHINQGVNSKIPIICIECGNRWVTTINSKSKCPNCSKHWGWTLSFFITRAQEIHEDKHII